MKNTLKLTLSLVLVFATMMIFSSFIFATNGDNLDMFVIKKSATGTASTEVHAMDGTNLNNFVLHTGTILGETGTDSKYVYQVGDYNGDNYLDIYVIQKDSTGTGKTEVHVLNGANNYQSWLLNTGTAFGKAGTTHSTKFLLGDYNKDGKLDIYVIVKANTGSNKTEVHILNGADNFQTYLLHTATALHVTGTDYQWDFQLGDYNNDGALDIYSINKKGGSGKTEVHVLNGVNNFQSFLANIITGQGPLPFNNKAQFQLGDYEKDGYLDLYVIINSGIGNAEVHSLTGANLFQTYNIHSTTQMLSMGAEDSLIFLLPEVNANYGYLPPDSFSSAIIAQKDMDISNTALVAELGFGLKVDATYQNKEIFFYGNDKIVNYCIPIHDTVTGNVKGVMYNYTLDNEGNRWVYLKLESNNLEFLGYYVGQFNMNAGIGIHQFAEDKINDGKAYRMYSATIIRKGKGQIVVDPFVSKVIENDVYHNAVFSAPTSTLVADDCNGNQITVHTKEVNYNGKIEKFGETTVCFTAGTKINTKEGLVNIEDIKEGDMVLSWNEYTGEFDYKSVNKIFNSETNQLIKLNIDGEIIETTPLHPFRTIDGQWVAANKLSKGIELLSATGKKQKVKEVELVQKTTDVYNLEIKDWNTYSVGEGALVVHNDCVIRGWLENNVEITFTAPTGGYVTVKPNFTNPDGSLALVPSWNVIKIGGTAGIGPGGIEFQAGQLDLAVGLNGAVGGEMVLQDDGTISNQTFAKVEAGIENLAFYGFELRSFVGEDGTRTTTMGHTSNVLGHNANVTYQVDRDKWGNLYTSEEGEQFFSIPLTNIRWDADNGWQAEINISH